MQYEINDDRVDADHRLILQLLESFVSLPDDSGRDTVLELLAKIKEHVVVHFVDEEFIFEKELCMPADYVTFHKQEHERIRDRVLSAIGSLQNDEGADMRATVSAIRRDMVNHIEMVDSKMVPYAARKRL